MDLNEYLMTVVIASSLGIVADILNSSLSQRWKGMERYIKFGITVCVASCMVIPFLKAVNGGEIISDEEIRAEYDMRNVNVDDSLYILEKECGDKLCEKIIAVTGINPVSVSIEMKMKDDIPVIDKALIILPKDCGKNDEVAEVVGNALGTEKYTVTEA